MRYAHDLAALALVTVTAATLIIAGERLKPTPTAKCTTDADCAAYERRQYPTPDSIAGHLRSYGCARDVARVEDVETLTDDAKDTLLDWLSDRQHDRLEATRDR